jgi:hypothetical protein
MLRQLHSGSGNRAWTLRAAIAACLLLSPALGPGSSAATESEDTPAACCTRGDHPVADDSPVSDEYFVATLSCSVTCRGHDPVTVTETHTYRPRDHGLHPGDGSDGTSAPWGSFTAVFEAWSRFTCLEAASVRCGALTTVDTSELVKVSSGDWSLDHRIECPTSRQIRKIERNDRDPRVVFVDYHDVLSPFDPASGAAKSGGSDKPPRTRLPFPKLGTVLFGPPSDPTRRNVDTFDYWARRAETFGEVPDSATTPRQVRRHLLRTAGVSSRRELVELMQREHGIPPPQPCHRVIRGRACYGDCLTFPDGVPMVQHMATNQVARENHGTFAVCGDNLLDFFATHDMTEHARDAYCEKFVADSLVAGRATASNCSSYRIRVDCSSYD